MSDSADGTIEERWRDGQPLGSAWFWFAPENLKEQFRDSGRNANKTAVLRIHMQRELMDNLAHGALIGYGSQSRPIPELSIRQLPAMLFVHGVADVDWDASEIKNKNFEFHNVTVVDPRDFELEPSDLLHKIEASPASQSADGVPPAPRAASRGGRHSTYELSRRALLLLKPELIPLSAEKLHSDFQDAYAKANKEAIKHTPAPGVRTLRAHLKRFRLEETGRNRQQSE
jgi:hypothetical protein